MTAVFPLDRSDEAVRFGNAPKVWSGTETRPLFVVLKDAHAPLTSLLCGSLKCQFRSVSARVDGCFLSSARQVGPLRRRRFPRLLARLRRSKQAGIPSEELLELRRQIRERSRCVRHDVKHKSKLVIV